MCTPTKNTVYHLIVFFPETQLDHSYTTNCQVFSNPSSNFFRLNQMSIPSKRNLAFYTIWEKLVRFPYFEKLPQDM